MRIGIAILAAGSSTRMGRAKQLLPWRGTSLIRAVIATALGSGLGPVAVVLGTEAGTIAREISQDPVQPILNHAHSRGQGTSVRAAARWAVVGSCDGLMLLLGDQPFVEAADLRRIAAAIDRGAAIAAAGYDEGPGAPALFTKRFYPQLLNLPEAQGARSLLRTHRDLVTIVPVAGNLSDLDTPSAYIRASTFLR